MLSGGLVVNNERGLNMNRLLLLLLLPLMDVPSLKRTTRARRLLKVSEKAFWTCDIILPQFRDNKTISVYYMTLYKNGKGGVVHLIVLTCCIR